MAWQLLLRQQRWMPACCSVTCLTPPSALSYDLCSHNTCGVQNVQSLTSRETAHVCCVPQNQCLTISFRDLHKSNHANPGSAAAKPLCYPLHLLSTAQHLVTDAAPQHFLTLKAAAISRVAADLHDISQMGPGFVARCFGACSFCRFYLQACPPRTQRHHLPPQPCLLPPSAQLLLLACLSQLDWRCQPD